MTARPRKARRKAWMGRSLHGLLRTPNPRFGNAGPPMVPAICSAFLLWPVVRGDSALVFVTNPKSRAPSSHQHKLPHRSVYSGELFHARVSGRLERNILCLFFCSGCMRPQPAARDLGTRCAVSVTGGSCPVSGCLVLLEAEDIRKDM